MFKPQFRAAVNIYLGKRTHLHTKVMRSLILKLIPHPTRLEDAVNCIVYTCFASNINIIELSLYYSRCFNTSFPIFSFFSHHIISYVFYCSSKAIFGSITIVSRTKWPWQISTWRIWQYLKLLLSVCADSLLAAHQCMVQLCFGRPSSWTFPDIWDPPPPPPPPKKKKSFVNLVFFHVITFRT